MTIITEKTNPESEDFGTLGTLEILRVINTEDRKPAEAVEAVLLEIARLVDEVVVRMRGGGRLIYIGTGTSGRLGVLDASEVPPTFGVGEGRVIGLIAGGRDAVWRATEGAEDDRGAAEGDLAALSPGSGDAVIGISASGNTPYTVGAAEFAKKCGCLTACVTNNPEAEILRFVDHPICAVTGPEVIAGSTRLKAGTAQKMILNMISTAVMVKLGYTLGNRMSNLVAGNRKLTERALEMVIEYTGLERPAAAELLSRCGKDIKTALVVHRTGASTEVAAEALGKAGQVVEDAVGAILAGKPDR